MFDLFFKGHKYEIPSEKINFILTTVMISMILSKKGFVEQKSYLCG